MHKLPPQALEGRYVCLRPLTRGDAAALMEAASESTEHYRLTTVPASLQAMENYIEAALVAQAAGLALPFATIDLERGRVVGSTRFANAEYWTWSGPPAEPVPRGPDAVEIGWTWLAHSAQRTAINTEAKLLMMTHAFETWGIRRLLLKTDARNLRSRTAIERLGLRLDGILRAHMPAADGGIRDSAVYSLLSNEWPASRAYLLGRLSQPISSAVKTPTRIS